MQTSKAGLRQLQVLLLELSVELTKMADDLAGQATMVNPDADIMSSTFNEVLEELPDTIRHYEGRFDEFFTEYVRHAEIA